MPHVTAAGSPASELLSLDRPQPDAIALRFPDRSLSYGQLRAQVASVADRLAGLRRVAVWAEPTIETAVATVACLHAGVPLIPLNPKAGEREREHMMSDGAPERILCAPAVELPSGTPSRLEVTIVERSASPALPSVTPDVSDDHPALIIYTSGTTGAPKGVVLPRRAVATNLDALADAWEWTAADVVGHALPLFHVHGLVLGILGPLRRGGTARHLGRFSPAAVGAALDEDVTVIFGVPTMYRRLAEAAEADRALADQLRRARLLVSGSAALAPAEHERLHHLCGQRVIERYGMTETLMITAIRADGDRRAGYVGPPLAGVEVEVLDDDGRPVPEDDETIGEVCVRGPNIFLEYLNRPDATSEVFVDGFFRTGDLATRAADAYVRIVGRRATDLIKSGGYKIGAGEIEAALREHPDVADAAVTAAPDDDLGEHVVAWIVTAENHERPTPEKLSEHVARLLAPHKRPRVVHFLEELPRNEMGKVQKRRLGSS